MPSDPTQISPSDQDLFVTLGISLALGLLVGLQRERSESLFAGIRTFPLITVFGSISAFLGSEFGGWIVATGLLAVAALGVSVNLFKLRDPASDAGQTTEVAALLMYALGAYLVVGSRAVAVVLTGAVVVLLHLKDPMHRFVRKMGERDLKAVMQFVVISLVILPILPNRAYGPYQILNPHDIWRMVVLIVALSLSGYVAYKLLGERGGTLVSGVLGGLISSTATTLAYARRTKTVPLTSSLAALVILLASTVTFVRVLVELAAVAPRNFAQLAQPLAAMLAVMAGLAGAAYFMVPARQDQMPDQENPAELKSALIFGALYAVIIFGVAAAKSRFGEQGLYVVALLSGLTDMDAITLSTARMVEETRLETGTAWRIILVASMANLVFKGALAGIVGDRGLLWRISLWFSLALASGAAILIAWP